MRTSFLFFILLCSLCAFAQDKDIFQETSLANALHQAKLNSKLVFIQFESRNCTTCNALADRTFGSKDLSGRMNQTFILLKITPDHPDRKQIAKDYYITNGFGSFIIDQNGTLIKRLNYSSSSPRSYEQMIEAALIEAGENLKINDLDRIHQDGITDPAFLELYIAKKKALYLPYGALLEEYARLLPADSLLSPRTLQFILRMEPSINSYAYHSLTQNKALFQQTWYKTNSPLRNTIKRNIIMKSMMIATRMKDTILANRIVSFIMDTEDKDLPHLETQRACDQLMMYYYKNSGNINQYFKNAVTYYDTYYLNRNLDSLKKADSIFRSRRFARTSLPQDRPVQGKITTNNIKTGIKRDTIITQTISQNNFEALNYGYVDDLNHGAMMFYHQPKNSELILKALSFAELSLAIRETATAYHALARLLYRLEQKEKAIEMQTKAIALVKQKGRTSEGYEKYLEKMKLGVEDIDQSIYNEKQQKNK